MGTGGEVLAPSVLMLLAGPSVSPMVLCQLQVSADNVHFITSGLLAFGAWNMFNRHPHSVDRTVPVRTATALVIGSAIHLSIPLVSDVPLDVFTTIPVPLALNIPLGVLLHYVGDYAVSPLFLANLAYVSGKTSYDVLPCFACSALSSTCFIGAGV